MKVIVTEAIGEELSQLKADGYRYIARDHPKYGGELAAYKGKPVKREGRSAKKAGWWDGEGAKILDIGGMRGIRFADEEPYAIDDLLKLCPKLKKMGDYINPHLTPKEYKREYMKNYRETHEEYREYCNRKTAQWKADNPEKAKEHREKYYQEHKEQILEKKRQYYQRHREQILEKAKQKRKERTEESNEVV